MLNIIRADLFRIFKGKGIYVTLSILLILASVTALLAGNPVADIEQNPTAYKVAGLVISLDDKATTSPEELTIGISGGFDSMRNALLTSPQLFYLLLAVVIFVCCTDFSSNTVKIHLTSGISRSKYYLSKLILSVIFCLLFLLLFLVITMGIGTMINGFGASTATQRNVFLHSLLSSLFLFSGIAAFFTFLAFVTQRSIAVVSWFLVWYVTPQLLSLIVGDKALLIDSGMIATKLAYISAFLPGDIIVGFIYAFVLLVGFTALGLIIFTKADIK